ncbi:MAG: efflux RND transporter periplasmic adaptor subunit [Spirochaetales bacterium]|nr:efflux RND transporter periplasmic adaptor subunit [Spirochaetales bacterium]
MVKIRPAHALWLIPVALIAIPGWRWLQSRDAEEPARVGVPVVVAQPTTGDLEIVLSYPGNLVAESTATVVPRIGGEVMQVLVSENERVTAGDPLVRMDDDIVRIQSEQALAAWQAALAQLDKAVRGVRPEELESAQATVSQSERDIEVAQTSLDRTRRLYDAGTVPTVDYENAENQLQSARTQLENARRSLALMEQGASEEDVAMATANADAAHKSYELALLQLEFATVSAPVSGTVARIMVEEGNSVGPGTPLLAIINDDLIYANVAVPEKHYGEFGARQGSISARVAPIAYPDNPVLTGRVTSIAPIIDARSRTFNVEIAVQNRGSLLRPGMFVNVELVMERVTDALIVPQSAVLFRNNSSVVYVVEVHSEPTVRMVPVETGVTQGTWVQIVSGLAPDAALAIEGNAFLEDGQVVRPIEAE